LRSMVGVPAQAVSVKLLQRCFERPEEGRGAGVVEEGPFRGAQVAARWASHLP
jgi:hypothetical protein